MENKDTPKGNCCGSRACDALRTATKGAFSSLLRVLRIADASDCHPVTRIFLLSNRLRLQHHLDSLEPIGTAEQCIHDCLRSAHQGIISIATELTAIGHILRTKRFLRIHGLFAALRRTERTIKGLRKANSAVSKLGQTHERLYAWGSSLVATIEVLAKACCISTALTGQAVPAQGSLQLGAITSYSSAAMTVRNGEARTVVWLVPRPLLLAARGGIKPEA